MTAYFEETRQQEATEEQKPIYRMLDAFTEATGLPWPQKWTDEKVEKWIHPLKAISDATGDNEDLRRRAIREAVQKCRDEDILIASPSSILSMALHIIAKWKIVNRANEPTEADFVAYRSKLLAMGANVLW